MMMFNEIKKMYSKLAFTKYQRIEKYIKLLQEKFELKKKDDLEIVKEINYLIEDTLKAVKILSVMSTISYFGIYFSFISAVFSGGSFLTGLTETIGAVVGFFGTTLFVVLLFFSNRLSALYYQDLNLMTAHLITIYSSNKMKDEYLFEGHNSYNSFIKFFKSYE